MPLTNSEKTYSLEQYLKMLNTFIDTSFDDYIFLTQQDKRFAAAFFFNTLSPLYKIQQDIVVEINYLKMTDATQH